MSIVGKVEKWWNHRNAVPEEKTRLLNERLARLFPTPPPSVNGLGKELEPCGAPANRGAEKKSEHP